MMEINKDINGKESSKRYWAKKFFTLGFWLAVVLFVFWGVSIFVQIEFEVPDALVEVWKWMMGFASFVILGTVFEKPKGKYDVDPYPHHPYGSRPDNENDNDWGAPPIRDDYYPSREMQRRRRQRNKF